MALRPQTTTANFEAEDGDTAVVESTSTANQVTVTTTPSTTVAVTKTAVAKTSPLATYKDAFKVSYDTCPMLTASQGKFSLKVEKINYGDEITLELISFQDSWVVGPGDMSADKELVKYSDDGITAGDGTDMRAHLQELKAQGYAKASMEQRVVLVGELLTTKGSKDHIGSPVQISLPDSGRKSFESHNFNLAYAASKGRVKVEDVPRIKLTIVPTTNKAGQEFSKVITSSAA